MEDRIPLAAVLPPIRLRRVAIDLNSVRLQVVCGMTGFGPSSNYQDRLAFWQAIPWYVLVISQDKETGQEVPVRFVNSLDTVCNQVACRVAVTDFDIPNRVGVNLFEARDYEESNCDSE